MSNKQAVERGQQTTQCVDAIEGRIPGIWFRVKNTTKLTILDPPKPIPGNSQLPLNRLSLMKEINQSLLLFSFVKRLFILFICLIYVIYLFTIKLSTVEARKPVSLNTYIYIYCLVMGERGSTGRIERGRCACAMTRVVYTFK